METLTETITSPVSFTESAQAEIKRLLFEDPQNAGKTLRVGVKGGGCSGMTYVLNFDEPAANDKSYEYNGVPFVIDAAHELYLAGMEIDWQGGLNSRGFTFNNPNASSTCGCGTSFAV